jgi:hypothetical protein
MRAPRPVMAAVIAALMLTAPPIAVGTAADPPRVSAGDVTVSEPSHGTGTVSVEVPITVLGGPTGAISVEWRAFGETATTADFVAASGTLTIPAGASGSAIPLEVRADKVVEPVETFSVELLSASGANVADNIGQVTIRPGATGLSLGDVAVAEPDSGTFDVAVPATLGGPPNKAVTFGWQLRSATATIGEDAPAASGTATIAKNTMGTLVRFSVNGDVVVEPDETLELVVTSVANASLSDGSGSVTLRNTDVAAPPPTPTPTPVATPTPTPTATPTPIDFGWDPPADAIAGSGTVLYVESAAGDYIGQGKTYRYTKADSVMYLSNQPNSFTLSNNGDEVWTLNIAEPSDYPKLQVGYWENVGRYPFYIPGLSFYGEGRGCNTSLGRFSVDAISYYADLIDTMTVRFEQRCEQTGPPLRGYFRWNRTDPTQPPPPGDPTLFPWSPPAGAVPTTGSYLYFESSTGDYIGQGRTRLFTTPGVAFSPTWNGPLVQLSLDDPATPGEDWSLSLDGRINQPLLAVGLYEDVQRYPFDNKAKGGLSFYGEGRGCNTLLGTFAVDAISYDPAGLASFSARFVQRCEETGPPLYAAVHWERP